MYIYRKIHRNGQAASSYRYREPAGNRVGPPGCLPRVDLKVPASSLNRRHPAARPGEATVADVAGSLSEVSRARSLVSGQSLTVSVSF